MLQEHLPALAALDYQYSQQHRTHQLHPLILAAQYFQLFQESLEDQVILTLLVIQKLQLDPELHLCP